MPGLKKILIRTALVFAVLILIVFTSLYFFQEKMIFFPTKLEANHTFKFSGNYEEVFITTNDKIKLNALLFKADSSKGVIVFLHGNGGCLESVGTVADKYTAMGYDLFLLDYRGYGKSEGEIFSEEQFYSDVQESYNYVKTRYPENKIVILGYSIGTGSAAMLASTNNPKLLILQAPYYSLVDMSQQRYPFAPEFLLKYRFETCEFVKKCKAPILIFHGNHDTVIDYTTSLELQKLFKSGDTLITLDGRGHGGFTDSPVYLKELSNVLSKQ